MAFGKHNKNVYKNERGSGIGTSIALVVSFLVFLAVLLYILYTMTIRTIITGNKGEKEYSTEISIVIPQLETEAETENETETEFVPVVLGPIDLKPLQASIEASIAGCEGSWSVYVSQLVETKNSIMINNLALPSASVMKIFIMGAVYDQVNKGTFQESDVYEKVAEMIGASSNSAANDLLKMLGNGNYAKGIEVVNKFIKSYGYDNGTVEYNGFEDPATVFGDPNVVSALDCGLFLEDLYAGRVISSAYCDEMLEFLELQGTTYKIPALLPADTVIMNKTGEMDGTENDVGIVLSPCADYVICILSSNWTDKKAAISEIQQISKMVYEYFNGEIDSSTPIYYSTADGTGASDDTAAEDITGTTTAAENTTGTTTAGN